MRFSFYSLSDFRQSNTAEARLNRRREYPVRRMAEAEDHTKAWTEGLRQDQGRARFALCQLPECGGGAHLHKWHRSGQ